MSDLTIVIVSYNTREHLEECLGSLDDEKQGIDREIVVVDNASTDGSVAAVRTRWPDVKIIQSAKNVGYARANNLGIRATTGDLILLLNSDTVVPAGAIDVLAQRLLALPDVAAIGPCLVDASGRPELSFGRMIGPLNEIIQKGKGLALELDVPVLAPWILGSLSRPTFPDWVSGACLLIRRADAESVGLFDERFFLYQEDVDLCSAIRGRGRRILFTPEVQVVHHRGRSRATAPERTQIAYRQSQLAFYAKHHPAWTPLLRLYLKIRGLLPTDSASPRL